MDNNANGNVNVQNPNMGTGAPAPKPKKPIYKKWWFWVIIGVVIIIIIAAASGSSDDKASKDSGNSDSVVSKEAEEKTEYAVGETINYDGVKMTMKKVKTSKGDKASFTEPDKGKEFVIGEVEIKNDSDEKISVNWASFEAYYDDNAVESDVMGQSLPEVKKVGELFGDVAPGKKIKGCVVYQVPKNWKKMEITPKFDYDLMDEQNYKYVIKNK